MTYIKTFTSSTVWLAWKKLCFLELRVAPQCVVLETASLVAAQKVLAVGTLVGDRLEAVDTAGDAGETPQAKTQG